MALSPDMGAYSSWPLSPSIARIENLQEPWLFTCRLLALAAALFADLMSLVCEPYLWVTSRQWCETASWLSMRALKINNCWAAHICFVPVSQLKHLHNVEKRFYCPQRRDDISESKWTLRDWKSFLDTWTHTFIDMLPWSSNITFWLLPFSSLSPLILL